MGSESLLNAPHLTYPFTVNDTVTSIAPIQKPEDGLTLLLTLHLTPIL